MSYLHPEARLIVFAKAPVFGSVKTRLIPELGEEGATDLYKRLLVNTLKIAKGSKVAPMELWIDKEHDFLLELAEKFDSRIMFQQGADLGEKMLGAFEETIPSAKGAVIIGTDCISLTKVFLQEAFDSLESSAQVVLGPAFDGGYVLIGMNDVQETLFKDIEWSTDSVLSKTKNLIDKLGLKYHELPTGYDVDIPSDLERLSVDLLKDLPRKN